MPGFDQTGPMGQGSMTGRRMGRCTNFGANLKSQDSTETGKQQENIPENFSGMGWGFGRGRGLGFRFGKGNGFGWGRGRGMGRQNRFRGGF